MRRYAGIKADDARRSVRRSVAGMNGSGPCRHDRRMARFARSPLDQSTVGRNALSQRISRHEPPGADPRAGWGGGVSCSLRALPDSESVSPSMASASARSILYGCKVLRACLLHGFLPLRACVPQREFTARVCDQTNQCIGFCLQRVIDRVLDFARLNIN